MTRRKLIVEFTKMSGAGNDFIVIDNRFYHFSDAELTKLARRWCARRTGVGADGLLAFALPGDEAHHFRMRYVNADGTTSMCGNGARCLARFARLTGVEAEELVFETDAGPYRAQAPADPAAPVRLFLPPAEGYAPDRVLENPEGPVGTVDYLWTGTHHAVCFVPAAGQTPVDVWGPAIRRDAAFAPEGTNVDFVEVVADGQGGGRAVLRVRTYEKGVEAETLACGTGAVAAALSARFRGLVHADVVDVRMPGGTLTVGRRGPDPEDLYLEGPADVVYRGTMEVEP